MIVAGFRMNRGFDLGEISVELGLHDGRADILLALWTISPKCLPAGCTTGSSGTSSSRSSRGFLCPVSATSSGVGPV